MTDAHFAFYLFTPRPMSQSEQGTVISRVVRIRKDDGRVIEIALRDDDGFGSDNLPTGTPVVFAWNESRAGFQIVAAGVCPLPRWIWGRGTNNGRPVPFGSKGNQCVVDTEEHELKCWNQ